MRNDASLVPPIRQTASIFKQPVTVIKTQPSSRVKLDMKHGIQDKPKQVTLLQLRNKRNQIKNDTVNRARIHERYH